MTALSLHPARRTPVGGTEIRRMLPLRPRRLIGPWCLLDHFGPAEVSATADFAIGAHPHIGIQTVTWLLDGELVHGDTLGSVQSIQPGQLNLMTSGHGISHWELLPDNPSGTMHGNQLWIALPSEHRNTEPVFDHYGELPSLRRGALSITVIIGELDGVLSPARTFSPLVGADVSIPAGGHGVITLRKDFEHAIAVVEGALECDAVHVPVDSLVELGPNRTEARLRSRTGARALLLGGVPFAEEVVMWWNFVARSRDEIAQAKSDWDALDSRFGEAADFPGDPVPAPHLRDVNR